MLNALIDELRVRAIREPSDADRDAEFETWNRRGRVGAMAHLAKQRFVRDFGAHFGLDVLVETGTFLGTMVAAMAPYFREVHSVELADALYRRAVRRFRGAPNVRLHHGDSGSALGRIVRGLDGPALFWLDGHYSGGATARTDVQTPILAELETILGDNPDPAAFQHVVLVDDARLFTGADDYPRLDEVREFVRAHGDRESYVVYDVLCVAPRGRRFEPLV